MKNHAGSPAYLYDIFWLVLIIGFVYSLFLGSYALFPPDEGRYAEIGREMAKSGDYITPYLNGVLYFEKPIFFYWLQSFSAKFLGLSEWAMRFWDAAFAIFGCILTYAFGRKLYTRKVGIYASIVLSSSLLYFAMGHIITLDMTLSVLLSGALLSLLTYGVYKQARYLYIAAIFSSLAFLTKGLVGIVFPLIIFGLWMILDKAEGWVRCICAFFESISSHQEEDDTSINHSRAAWGGAAARSLPHAAKLCFASTAECRHARPHAPMKGFPYNINILPIILSLFLWLIIAAPWHILLQLKHSEFFHFYFIEQQFLRYSTDYAHRFQPFYFFIPIAIAGFLPWVFYLIPMIKQWRRDRLDKIDTSKENYFLIWVIFILIFFSASKSKLIPYILPIFPALALCVAQYFDRKDSGVGVAFMSPAVETLQCNVSTGVNFCGLKQGDHKSHLYRKIIFLALISWIVGITAFANLDKFNTQSIKPLANYINHYSKPEDIIISYQHYYQDLPFYTRRVVELTGCRTELDFGLSIQKTNVPMISEDEFNRQWNGEKRVFAVMRLADYNDWLKNKSQQKIYILAKTAKNILASNHGFSLFAR